MDAEWYFVDKVAGQHGPTSFSALKDAWQSGSIDETCLVWNENLAAWTELAQLSELRQQLAHVPPVPSPAPSATASTPSPAPAAAAASTAAPAAGGGGFDITSALKSAKLKKAKKKKKKGGGGGDNEGKAKRGSQVSRFKKSKKKGDADEGAGGVEEVPAGQRVAKQTTWQELYTTDGLVYYYNSATGVTTWDKPDELKSASELGRSGEWCWLPHATDAFVPARLVETYADGRRLVEKEDLSQSIVSKKTKLIPLKWSQLQRLPRDLVMLDEMNEALILYDLKQRFAENEIYTNVGTILISCNPYKRLPLYTPSVIDDYRHRGTSQLAPHVFVIADDAYTQLIETQRCQSIVISGESGAGKTECTKQCLQYLAEVAGSDNNVEQKILMANPILEAFGNAKTVRNNNSSRFGKYVEINFNQRNAICGAVATNYLLEKSRVVYQAPGERNFHIFYQLCAGASEEQRARYGLLPAGEFHYANQSGDITIPGVDDAQEYAEMHEAMEHLEFSEGEVDDVWALIAGLLHLGNVRFADTGDRKCSLESDCAMAAQLLQIEEAKLAKGVTSKTMHMPGQAEDINISLSAAEANDTRDALAKFIYSKLFDWLVGRVNRAIGGGGPEGRGRSIGILDIFGFEIFEANSFEQLCINFANEKLQQFFNAHTFKMEETVYQREQIRYDHVEYIDNQGVLDLIEKKPKGILPMLDEELRMPKGSDAKYVSKLIEAHRGTEEFDSVLASADMFAVHHYAGSVGYDSRGFLHKNRDRLSEDAYDLLQASNFEFLRSLFPKSADATARKTSLGKKFGAQLNRLMKTLNSTEPHYIRCIKPNPNKAPLEFLGTMVLEQLRYSGVFEAVTIRKQGFPFRLKHDEFWKRYRCVLPKKTWPSPREACVDLIGEMGFDLDEPNASVQMGVSMVLYRADKHRDMELKRNMAIQGVVTLLQSHIRRWLATRLLARLRKLEPILEKALASRDIDTLDAALEKCGAAGFETLTHAKCKRLRFVLVEERRINKLLATLVDKDPEKNFEEMSKAVAAADEIELRSEMADRVRERLQSVKEMRQCRADLTKGIAEADHDALESGLTLADKLGVTGAEVEQARAMLERIQAEQSHIAGLEKAIAEGGWLQKGDSIDWSGLEAALADSHSFEMKTKEGMRAERLATLLVDVRKAMAKAVGTTDSQLWRETEAVVMHAGEEFSEQAELKACRNEVSLLARESEVAERLEAAIAAANPEQLRFGVDQAASLGMNADKWAVVGLAGQWLEHIDRARQLLRDAMSSRVELDLIYAVEFAESFGFEAPEVAQCRELRDTVLQLNVEAKQARRLLVEPEMRSVVERATAANVTSPDIQALYDLLYNTSAEKFVQLQLKAAVQLQDPRRVVQTTIQLKEIFFAKSSDMFAFANFPPLWNPVAWADRKFLSFSRDELARGMLKWTKHPIHSSLTEMHGKINKEACNMFKSVLGYMGDRSYSYPDVLLHDVLTKALEVPRLRDELYCQIVKQLTNNPNPDSSRKGWLLMAVCLETFPPAEFENYLEIFLRSHAPDSERYVHILHNTVYGGPRHTVPTEAEVRSIQGGQSLRPSALDVPAKEYPRPQAQLYSSGRPIPPPPGQSGEARPAAGNPAPPELDAVPGLPAHLEDSVPHEIVHGHGPRVSVSFKLPPKVPQPRRPAGPPRGNSNNDLVAAAAQAPPPGPQRAAPPPPPPTQPPVSNWAQAFDAASNSNYWYNKLTGETKWTLDE